MRISILTLFPDMFAGPFDYSIVKRAKEQEIVTINLVNIRDFTKDSYKSVDDHPYGGGVGMVMRVDILDRAVQYTKRYQQNSVIPAQAGIYQEGTKKLDPRFRGDDIHVVLLDPRGATFTQKKAREYAKLDHLILVCGHYEGVDERVTSLVDESVSIGDYVLTGGEIPAMVITDSVVRLLPGVLKPDATVSESFSLEIGPPAGGWKLEIPVLEYPQYTRPPEYKGMRVPDVLLSGDHQNIEEWKKQNSIAQKGRVSRRRA